MENACQPSTKIGTRFNVKTSMNQIEILKAVSHDILDEIVM